MKTLMHNFKKNRKQGIALFAIAASFISYAYAIAETTISISSSESMNQELQELQTDIAELELVFFERVDDFSLEMAQERNLSETKVVYYADRNDETTVAFNDL